MATKKKKKTTKAKKSTRLGMGKKGRGNLRATRAAGGAQTESKKAKGAWTLMVYLAGDNNLTEEMVWGLQELKKTSGVLKLDKLPRKDRVNVVAHFDPRGSHGRRYDIAPVPKAAKRVDARLDGNLDRYESVVFSESYVDAATTRRIAREVFDETAAGLAKSKRDELSTKLAEFLFDTSLARAVRRAPAVAADFLAEGFVGSLSEAERKLIRGVNLVGPIESTLRRIEGQLVENGDAGAALLTFVEDQLEHLEPSREFCVVLSGHGSGAVGDFLTDLDASDSLSIPELAVILGAARWKYSIKHGHYEKPGKKEHKRIGIVGMDSCLMSTAEVCFEIREHANFVVSSEGFVLNTGWPYDRLLEALCDHHDPEDAAVTVANAYADFYQDYEISGAATDISVCRLDAFRKEGGGSFVEQLRAFARDTIEPLERVHCLELREGAPAKLEATRKSLAAKISDDLGNPSELETALVEGSKGAQQELLRRGFDPDDVSATQRRALVALLDAIEGIYHVQDELLADRFKKLRRQLPDALQGKKKNHVDLAAARVLREFDPAVERALELIEQAEAAGKPEAKNARERLQKFHQISFLVDLAGFPGPPTSAKDKAFRDAVATARWQAQTFKGGVYVDLFDFCERVAAMPGAADVHSSCVALRETLRQGDKGPIALSRYTGADFQHAHGLSVYFPVESIDYAAEYENLAFAERTGWGRLVRAYLRATRRARRGESRNVANKDSFVRRFGDLAVDPLEVDTIEARIAGVVFESAGGDSSLPDAVRAGTAKKIKAGTAKKIKAGTAKKIKAGTAKKSKGDSILAILGNPPDGFYRHRRE